MITRFALISDTEQITRLVLANGQELDGRWAYDHEHMNKSHFAELVIYWIRDHYVRVVEHGQDIVGCIIAQMTPNLWNPKLKTLESRSIYVIPSSRNGRASVMLWTAWDQDVSRYLDEKKISMAVMSSQPGRTNINFKNRGWDMADQLWVRC
jgi:hypothetical protein